MAICVCCKLEDSTTMQSDGLCNYCFNNCKKLPQGQCAWKGQGPKPNYVTTYTTWKECHKGPVLVIDNGEGLKIYGSSRMEAKNSFYKFDLVIGLGERVEPDFKVYANVRSVILERFIEKFYKKPEHIVLGWPDMGVPNLSREFWLELVEVIKKKGRDRARSGGAYKVLFHCMGGHGRTGTALAILGALVGKWEGDLVDIVREKHCEKAVEADSQIAYIEKITKIKLKRGKGSKDSKSSSKKKDKKDKANDIQFEAGWWFCGYDCTMNGKHSSEQFARECKGNEIKVGDESKWDAYTVCSGCKTKYNTVSEALNCKKGDKCWGNLTGKGTNLIVSSSSSSKKEEKPSDDYFESRKKWRKEYSN